MSLEPRVFFTMPMPGVLHVLLNRETDTAPEKLEPLVSEVERISQIRTVGIIAQFAPGIRTVDMRVIQQWIGVVTRPNLRLVAAAVVTDSPLVRLAAQTIGLGTRVRGAKFEVGGFSDIAEAFAFMRRLVV